MTKHSPVPARVKQERESAKRLSRILRLIDDGYSYAEIGRMLCPQITRQRVSQIVRAAQA
jgi:DNA-binding NarL/FixJ family response regulator